MAFGSLSWARKIMMRRIWRTFLFTQVVLEHDMQDGKRHSKKKMIMEKRVEKCVLIRPSVGLFKYLCFALYTIGNAKIGIQ